jgi:hypothetical protein
MYRGVHFWRIAHALQGQIERVGVRDSDLLLPGKDSVSVVDSHDIDGQLATLIICQIAVWIKVETSGFDVATLASNTTETRRPAAICSLVLVRAQSGRQSSASESES